MGDLISVDISILMLETWGVIAQAQSQAQSAVDKRADSVSSSPDNQASTTPISSDSTPLSNNSIRHITSRHNVNEYIQQLAHKPEDTVRAELINKSFFNAEWNEQQIIDAVNYGYNEALQKGITTGKYKFAYAGELITVCLENGGLQTAYGSYKFTYEQLIEILKKLEESK